ncbi:MAG: hypothetical protein WC223_10655 [Bacteroidales bacterium]
MNNEGNFCLGNHVKQSFANTNNYLKEIKQLKENEKVKDEIIVNLTKALNYLKEQNEALMNEKIIVFASNDR